MSRTKTSISAQRDVAELLALSSTKTVKNNAKCLYKLQRVLCSPIFGEVISLECDELAKSFLRLYPDEPVRPRIYALYEACSIVSVVPCVILAVSSTTRRFLSLSCDRRALTGMLHDTRSVRKIKLASRETDPILDKVWGVYTWLPIWNMFSLVTMNGEQHLDCPTRRGRRVIPLARAKILFEQMPLWSSIDGSYKLLRANPVETWVTSGLAKTA